MKRILLTSTALVAFAGAASADGHAEPGITWGGDAEISWNSDRDNLPAGGGANSNNFQYGVGMTVSAFTALDNGLTVSGSLDVDLMNGADNAYGLGDVETSDWVLTLASDNASLNFGDVNMAAANNWVSAGDMEQDGFLENNDGGGEDAVIRGDMSFGSVNASVSYGVNSGDLEGLQLAVSADLGGWTVGVAMEDDGLTQNDTMGIYATGAVGGATLTVAYASSDVAGTTEDSTGIKVSYPIGDVTVGAYYVMESLGDDNLGIDVAYASGPLSVGVYYRQEQAVDDMGIDVDYDMGNGVTLKGGLSSGNGSDDGYYIGAAYDLGGGASVSLVHTDVDNYNTDNEYFGDDDKLGTTMTLSFKF